MPPAATHSSPTTLPATPLTPIVLVTFFASLATGVMWSGLSFIAESVHGYGRFDNFLLALSQGVSYVLAAFAAGRVTRALERRLTPRSLLQIVFLVQGAVAMLPIFFGGVWTLWAIAIVVSMASAIQWPLVESYLTAGRSGTAMRGALGWWNVVWMSATAIAVALIGPVIDAGLTTWAFALLAPNALLCVAVVSRFGVAPGEHVHDLEAPVPATYRHQLASVRVLLPTSYVVVAAISPLMPYVTGAFSLSTKESTLITATWLVARLVAVTILWRTRGWHGRWATLFVAGVLIASGFATAVLAPAPWMLVLGLAAFGLGQGVIYYAALYYAMRVGNAEVGAAGTHEGLIGVGYAVGPFIGLFSTIAAHDDLDRNRIFVVAIWATMALVAWPAVRPWVRERQRGAAVA